ncbi:hypothetical protein HK096_004963 [Nowakowskiella sp. JEL0078]|nr:hypothetical protein HK096_004963 [Nowakowskiella sp. JEL0078]
MKAKLPGFEWARGKVSSKVMNPTYNLSQYSLTEDTEEGCVDVLFLTNAGLFGRVDNFKPLDSISQTEIKFENGIEWMQFPLFEFNHQTFDKILVRQYYHGLLETICAGTTVEADIIGFEDEVVMED